MDGKTRKEIMEKWMVAHLDNGKNGLKFQIIGILRFPSIFYQAWWGEVTAV
jgi:hypothetical protein